MKYFLYFIILFFPVLAISQSVNLHISAAESGEILMHAHAINLQTQEGKVADENGRISLKAETGDTIFVSYVGYRDTLFQIQKDILTYNIPLVVSEMDAVVIFAEEPFNRRAAEGKQDISMEFLKALPAFNGDPDILKAITFLPGVTGGKDGYSHMYVRGGDQDENLILLDGAPLYNTNHFGGFISMFHSDMIQNVDFYKGYWPSQFGGRLSSVMDIQTKSGNFKEHLFLADLSPISSKAHASGPLWKDKISYIIGGRRTFFDLLFLKNLAQRTRDGKRRGYAPLFAFHDINGKINAKLSENQNLTFSVFQGNDRFFYVENEKSQTADNEYNILNNSYALNYKYYPNASTSLLAHVSSSFYRHYFEDNYHYFLPPTTSEQDISYRHSGNTIQTFKAQLGGKTSLSPKWEVTYGLDHETINYKIYLDRSLRYTNPNENILKDSFSIRTNQHPAYISAGYADMKYSLNSKWRIKSGVRIPYYRYDDFSTWLYEPKILISYDISQGSTLNASYNRQMQFSHLLSYFEPEGYFREFYTTSDADHVPSKSDQWSLGLFHRFKNEQRWISEANLSIEIFYKRQNLLNKFIPGFDPDADVVNYQNFLFTDGEAQSYGLEFLFQKTAGKFHGSLGYTLSRSQIRFPDLNQGKVFNADFDHRHNINLLLIYKFRKGYQLSAQWDFRSGSPFTISGSLSDRDEIIPGRYPILSNLNNVRYPDYHRLDLSLDREWYTKRRGNKQWFGISLYNAYNHVNPFYAYPENEKLKVIGFFPLIPSFHFGFELSGKKKKNGQ